MADSYPKVPNAAWRTLRARVASAPSTKLTPSNVAAMLGMANPDSARTNVVAPLRKLGLIEEDGSLPPLGQKWRVDASYGDACEEIVDKVYPSELAALTGPDDLPDVAQIKTWMEHKGFGGSNARQMASTYVMVAGKVIPEPPDGESKKAAAKKGAHTAKKPSSTPPVAKEKATPAETLGPDGTHAAARFADGPTVHLDIQIHLPADLSPDQIDQIFSSMAKHLYGRG